MFYRGVSDKDQTRDRTAIEPAGHFGCAFRKRRDLYAISSFSGGHCGNFDKASKANRNLTIIGIRFRQAPIKVTGNDRLGIANPAYGARDANFFYLQVMLSF